MKSIVFALALSLGALAGTAQAQTPAELCYAWAANSPSGVLKLLGPHLKAEFTARKITGKARTRATQCIAGGLPTLRDEVVALCAVGNDPSALIRLATTTGAEPCFEESAEKPTKVLPAETEPEPVTPAEEQ